MWGWFFLDKQPHASANMWFSEISFLPKEFGTMTVKLNRFFFKPKPIVIQDNKAISFSKQVDFIWLDVELWASRLHYENVGCCVSTFMSVLCPLLPQGCTSEAKKKNSGVRGTCSSTWCYYHPCKMKKGRNRSSAHHIGFHFTDSNLKVKS